MSEKEIKLEDCKDGYLYQIGARNSDLGVFSLRHKGFVINREKFGDKFLFAEYHWDIGAPHGTAKCIKELEKAPDFAWGEWHKSTYDQEQEMLKWLEEKEAEYDIDFERTLRYATTYLDSKIKEGKRIESDILANTIQMWCRHDGPEKTERIEEALKEHIKGLTNSE